MQNKSGFLKWDFFYALFSCIYFQCDMCIKGKPQHVEYNHPSVYSPCAPSQNQPDRTGRDRQLDDRHPEVIKTTSDVCTYHPNDSVCHLNIYMCVHVFRGVCRSCGSELESIQLTAEEYQQLKDRVMTDIIEGQDVFTKTTPEVKCTHKHRDLKL